jgi:hypothetical protein
MSALGKERAKSEMAIVKSYQDGVVALEAEVAKATELA